MIYNKHTNSYQTARPKWQRTKNWKRNARYREIVLENSPRTSFSTRLIKLNIIIKRSRYIYSRQREQIWCRNVVPLYCTCQEKPEKYTRIPECQCICAMRKSDKFIIEKNPRNTREFPGANGTPISRTPENPRVPTHVWSGNVVPFIAEKNPRNIYTRIPVCQWDTNIENPREIPSANGHGGGHMYCLELLEKSRVPMAQGDPEFSRVHPSAYFCFHYRELSRSLEKHGHTGIPRYLEWPRENQRGSFSGKIVEKSREISRNVENDEKINLENEFTRESHGYIVEKSTRNLVFPRVIPR